MKVGFTGTQAGMTWLQRSKLMAILSICHADELHHGQCVGADEGAHHMALRRRMSIVIHPPINRDKIGNCPQPPSSRVTILESKEYLDRNHDIVDATDFLVATPGTDVEELRSGTWATVRYARKQGREIHIIKPDGTVIVENKPDTM